MLVICNVRLTLGCGLSSLTCCCILLPVVTQTALQPLFFFERAWSLYLLRQMGYDLVTDIALGSAVVPGEAPRV